MSSVLLGLLFVISLATLVLAILMYRRRNPPELPPEVKMPPSFSQTDIRERLDALGSSLEAHKKQNTEEHKAFGDSLEAYRGQNDAEHSAFQTGQRGIMNSLAKLLDRFGFLKRGGGDDR